MGYGNDSWLKALHMVGFPVHKNPLGDVGAKNLHFPSTHDLPSSVACFFVSHPLTSCGQHVAEDLFYHTTLMSTFVDNIKPIILLSVKDWKYFSTTT